MALEKAVEVFEDDDELVDELQPGTKLLQGQYTIVRYINSGGFGITYLAKDSLDRDVVIKECFPSAFCRRSRAMVSARSRTHTAELRSVVQLFVREARHLSKIVHPNIVAVHQVFEDNGTAYMAIDYINGLDLQQIIDGEGVKPKAEEIVLITEKLLAAVGFIHAQDMLHRDISPDNILIDQKGQPILIDFGAAREHASQTNRAMSALRVVKDGYSPQEFYIAGSEQGPWSDLYALGATLYHLISGEAPFNGQARLAALAEEEPDPYVPLVGRIDGYPPGFLAAVDKALSTLPKQRVQSAQEWLSMFRPGVKLPLDPNEDMAAAVQAMVTAARAPAAARIEGTSTGPSAFGAPPKLTRQVSEQLPAPSAAATKLASEAAPGALPTPAAQPITVAEAQPESAVEHATELEPLLARRGISPVQVMSGLVGALAIVGIGIIVTGHENILAPAIEIVQGAVAPAASEPETATETAAAAPQVAVEAAAATAEAPLAPEIAAPAVVDQTAAAAPQPAAQSAIEGAPAVAGAVLENQIGFAAWDATLPFVEDNRIVSGQRVSIIQRLSQDATLTSAGDWLTNGLIIYSVNGVDVQQSGSIIAAVLNVMQVDPDGKARVVVQYSDTSMERQTGLMTVTASRLITLANGVGLTVINVDGEWRSVVTALDPRTVTTLREGDILARDKVTGQALNGPLAVESLMTSLAASGAAQAEFDVIRNGDTVDATMALATAAGQ